MDQGDLKRGGARPQPLLCAMFFETGQAVRFRLASKGFPPIGQSAVERMQAP